VTDDRRRSGPDHAFAMEPPELAAMVRAIRELEAALGDGEKRPRPDEEGERTWARRGVYAARALGAGARLEARDLKVVRPALGLPPSALPELLGRPLRRALEVDEPLRPEDV
jgi:sialic acid synthase SpsE